MDNAKIKFTIPDGTPEEQIKQIKDIKETMLAFAKLTGETIDTKPFDDAIEKLSTPPQSEKGEGR